MSAHSTAAERAILATMLHKPDTIAEMQLMLVVEDFFHDPHRDLFTLLIELAEGARPIEPMFVYQTLQERGRLAGPHGLGPLLAEVLTYPGGPAFNYHEYAGRIRELHRVRQVRTVADRLVQSVAEIEDGWWSSDQAGQPEVDHDRLQMRAAHASVELDAIADERMQEREIAGLMRWSDFLLVPDRPEDWLVPGLLGKKDVWMVLGGEGGGKSWFSRQWCFTMCAGIHPFLWDEFQRPVRTLLIDLENDESMVRRQSRPVHGQAARFGNVEHLDAESWIWTHPEGLNLREREDQLMFRSVLDQVRPEFVAMGSLYNAFQKGRDDWETAAEDVKTFLNRMRVRYDFALLLEHHMPKGSGGDRPQTPYGSSVWMRWVTHGHVLDRVGENLWEFTPFRGARDARPGIPIGLERGGAFPWAPIMNQGEFDARLEIEDELANRRRVRL